QTSAKLPRVGASDKQAGRTEPGAVVAGRAQSEEDAHIPLEDAGETQEQEGAQEHEGAREPNSKQQDEQTGQSGLNQ
ncbi:hypothetical protein FS837_001316, partial [Tulasnella sp. UAMH 9824]